jgi:hypothetical protein
MEEDELHLDSDERNYDETVDMSIEEFKGENPVDSEIDYHGRTGILLEYDGAYGIVDFGYTEFEEEKDIQSIEIDELIEQMY